MMIGVMFPRCIRHQHTAHFIGEDGTEAHFCQLKKKKFMKTEVISIRYKKLWEKKIKGKSLNNCWRFLSKLWLLYLIFCTFVWYNRDFTQRLLLSHYDNFLFNIYYFISLSLDFFPFIMTFISYIFFFPLFLLTLVLILIEFNFHLIFSFTGGNGL